MKLNKLFVTVFLSLSVAGCSGLTGRQTAATINDRYHPPPKQTAPAKPEIKKQTRPSQAVVTTPLEPVPPPRWATSIEQSQPQHLSPVVVALISDADRNTTTGNLDSAVATLERGLRIDPRNATLLYKLAEVRLKQSKPRLAEDLAKKSALLAGGDRTLKKRSWLLVAKARKMQGNVAGAKEAELKASTL